MGKKTWFLRNPKREVIAGSERTYSTRINGLILTVRSQNSQMARKSLTVMVKNSYPKLLETWIRTGEIFGTFDRR